MRRNKRSSLNLSVNAIVVFVLAFAMLGVGLWFVNEIRENLRRGTEGLIDPSELRNPPTADEPITMPAKINIKVSGTEEIEVGFYNSDVSEAKLATVGLLGCTYNAESEDPPGSPTQPVLRENLPQITSAGTTVPPNSAQGYAISIKEKGELTPGVTYICKFVIYKEGDIYWQSTPTPTIYEDRSGGFFLNVVR